MVTTVYLVRHAEAEGNVNETFQGRVDTEVTEKGMRQLDCLAERFRDIPIQVLYASPLKRTRVTAAAVNRYHQLPVQYMDELMEINGGVWEGKPWADLPRLYPESYRLWQEQMHLFHVQGGESMQQVFDRMRQAVCGIAAKHPGKTIAVVSHGCAIRNFLCYAAGEDISHLDQVGWADNTAVSKVEFDASGHCRLIFKNDASHLPPELSTLAQSKWCRHDGKAYLTDQTYTPGANREQEAQV